jgi:hypothetical protein
MRGEVMEKYNWYLDIIFKSGKSVKGYIESEEGNSNKLFCKIMHIGEIFNGSVYESMYTENYMKGVIYFDITDVDAILFSDILI